MPDDIAGFLDTSRRGNQGHVTSVGEATEDDEDDVPLLSMENPTLYISE